MICFMNNKKSSKRKKNKLIGAEKVEKKEEKQDLRTKKRKIGDFGEDVAVRFLMKQGYDIMDRNYLKPYGELDIVALKQEKIYFIEVKTVTKAPLRHVIHETSDNYRPEDNVHAYKLKRLSNVIQAYVLEKRIGDKAWQFNVITVYLVKEERKAYINMLEDIIL